MKSNTAALKSSSFQQFKLTFMLPSALVTLAIILSACAYNPATKSMDIVLMSESNELKIGKEEHQKIMDGTPMYPDEKVVEYINEIGQKLAANGDRPELTYHFNVIDDPMINAFALPGGYIYISRGILAYLQSEAELAAVLAHEIGHVTARHAVRQDAQRKGANIATGLATIFTQSYEVGEATSLWLGSAVSGYGREMELEADGIGAEYLYRSGYDPQAMVSVISTLKDQERFTRLRNQAQGKKAQTYHGVFSTHPRNDQRLREIIDNAGKLPGDANKDRNESRYREVMEGVVYGVNYDLVMPTKNKPDETKPNRFIHENLGIAILFPENWVPENQTSAIVAQPEDKSANMKMEVKRIPANILPDEYIRQELGIKLLQKSEPMQQHSMVGHTGIIPGEGENQPQRLAVFYQGSRVFIITCSVTDPQADVNYDEMFMASIRTFQPIRVARRSSSKNSKTIHYVLANEKTTYDALAQALKMDANELRLINGHYPRGEPEVGEWIKIIQ